MLNIHSSTFRPAVSTRIFLAGLLTVTLLSIRAQSATITGTPCQAAVVTPCLVGSPSGPVLITDPAQIGYTIIAGPSGTNASGATSQYSMDTLFLAADPAVFLTQEASTVAALVAAGNAPVAPNPGGALVVTNSVTTALTGTFIDTPVTQRADAYQTTIEAVLNGGATVFNQTFALPFGDPAVQAAITAADSILAGDGATFGSPHQTAASTTFSGSQLSYQTTGQSISAEIVTTSTTFGPSFLAVSDNLADLFTVIPGQTDINVNSQILYDTERNAITTNSYLTSQTYEIDGATPQTAAAPEPASWLLLGAAILLSLGMRKAARWEQLRLLTANAHKG